MKTELLIEKTELDSTQNCIAKNPTGNGYKLWEEKYQSDIRKKIYMMTWSKTGTGAQRGCRISLLGDVQNLTGQDPGQPNLLTLLSVGSWT